MKEIIIQSYSYQSKHIVRMFNCRQKIAKLSLGWIYLAYICLLLQLKIENKKKLFCLSTFKTMKKSHCAFLGFTRHLRKDPLSPPITNSIPEGLIEHIPTRERVCHWTILGQIRAAGKMWYKNELIKGKRFLKIINLIRVEQ